MKYSRVRIECLECNKEIYIKKYLVNKPVKYGRFCSASCRSKYVSRYNPQSQPNRITVSCANCGKELNFEPYRILERNFCSNSCRGKYGLKIKWPNGATTKKVTCSFCGKDIIIPEWEYNDRLKRGQKQFFCNRSCFGEWKSYNWGQENNPAWRGGHTPYYGSNWQRQARKARARDKYTCQACGITEKELGKALDIHHKIRFGDFDGDWKAANSLENLIAYCHTCHMQVEYS